MGNFIPTTGHPNGDAVPVVSTQHQSSLGKVVRADTEIQECKCQFTLAVLLPTKATGFTPCLQHGAADTVQAMRREVDGAAGGVMQRQHEQEQKCYFHMFDLTQIIAVRKLLRAVA